MRTAKLIGIPLALLLCAQVEAQVAADKARPAAKAATTYIETFPDPLGDWESRWFYQNTNAQNFYVSNGNDCDPNYRGNQPDGLWITDDRACGGLVAQSPVRINFSGGFGNSASSFSIDQFTCVDGVTFNIYDRNGALAVSQALPNTCFVWQSYAWPLANGISAFEYVYSGSQVEGNTSIDNVSLTVGGNECDIDGDGDYDRDDVRAYLRRCLDSGASGCFRDTLGWARNVCGGLPPGAASILK